jgi:thiamine pyrophosphate-dependent acetolactate synthase large subunit-like protein
MGDAGPRVRRDEGQFSDASPRSANAAPGALACADLVVLVGQHCMPAIGEFAVGPDAKYIRIDPAAEDIGRNVPIDVGIVSREKAALEALAGAVPRLSHDAWLAEIAVARALKKVSGRLPCVGHTPILVEVA